MSPAPADAVDPGRAMARALVAVTAFVLAGFLGRATIIDDAALSLVWPAAGVAALWVASARSRAVAAVDVTMLAIATSAVNSLTGARASMVAVFVVANVSQVLAFAGYARWRLPELWGFGGEEPLRKLADLGQITIAAALSSAVGAGTGSLGLWLVFGRVDPTSAIVWWGRNCVAVIVIVTLGLLAGRPLLDAGSPRRAVAAALGRLRRTPARRFAEGAGLIALSAALYGALFLTSAGSQFVFLVLVMSVWAGIRFPAVAVALHGMAMGAAGVVFTIADLGPFSQIESVHVRALAAQVFVAMSVLTGLALAFSRSERDRANRELAAARQSAADRARLLDEVVKSMSEGVVVLDGRERVVVRNPASRELLGLAAPADNRIEPATAYGLFHPNGLAVTDEELPGRRALRGEVVEAQDYHARSPGIPQGRVVEISARPLEREEAEGGTWAVVNLRDVTLDRQHRDALASFAGVAAHDLLNPLTLIRGWSESLEDRLAEGPLDTRTGLEMVARIHTATLHMQDFIADLLAFTVARDQSLRPERVDLTAMVRSLATLRSGGPAAPVIAVDDGLEVWADPARLRQVFDNLIGNAIKYAQPGVRPAISVTGGGAASAGADGRAMMEIRVTDNGLGIPAEERDKVFDSFHRAHQHSEGTGLGLAICSRIIDRHGGEIHAEGGPHGIGTTVVLTVPATAPAREGAAVEGCSSAARRG